MREMSAKVREIAEIFKDSEKTTFVCVCIPEFLSVFETERLIQELAKFEIDWYISSLFLILLFKKHIAN